MDRANIEPAIKLIIAEIHTRLSEATRIAKAAEACVGARCKRDAAGLRRFPTEDT